MFWYKTGHCWLCGELDFKTKLPLHLFFKWPIGKRWRGKFFRFAHQHCWEEMWELEYKIQEALCKEEMQQGDSSD